MCDRKLHLSLKRPSVWRRSVPQASARAWWLAVVALVVFACGQPNQSARTDPSAAAETPTVVQVVDGPFMLTLTADRSARAGTPIGMIATLAYVGHQRVVFMPGSGPVRFSLKQLDGPIQVGPGGPLSCSSRPFEPGETYSTAFIKSGSFSPGDPNAEFYRRFFAEEELILPEGEWEIAAVAAVSFKDCDVLTDDSMRAVVRLTIRP